MVQLMPLPLTVSCSSKIQIGFTFLVPAHPGRPGQRAVKRVCVCVLAVDSSNTFQWAGKLTKLLLPIRNLHLQWFFGTTRPAQVHTPNGTSISSATFVGLAVVSNRQTHRPHYICSNRPHLAPVLRCGLTKTTSATTTTTTSFTAIVQVTLCLASPITKWKILL